MQKDLQHTIKYYWNEVQSQRRRWIFKGDKNPQHILLLVGSKARKPMS
jgi:hypothetical protein